MKTKKRFLTILLSLVLVLGLMPGMSLTAYADGNVASVTVGETTTNYANLTDAVTAWNSAANAATLKLLADVTTASTISVSGTKTLDLNGYGIKMTSNSRVINVSSGANLTLNDSNATLTDTSDNRPNGVTGGYITGGNSGSANGGGIYIGNGGIAAMTGGTIIGNKTGGSNYGGGVCVDNGYFEMTGGTITGNEAQFGGGVDVRSCNASGKGFVFGGTAVISGNIAYDEGGGINIGGSGVVSITGGNHNREYSKRT